MCGVMQFSGGRPEQAMAQYLEWHMSQVGAKDALLQQRLFAALSHLRQHAPPNTFQKASRYLRVLCERVVGFLQSKGHSSPLTAVVRHGPL